VAGPGRSILLVLQSPLLDDVFGQLVHASRRGSAIDVLFNRFREGAYLKRLHEAGMRLYETAMAEAERSAVFVDRHQGSTLPTWVPIEEAFSRVYQLLWRRLGGARTSSLIRPPRSAVFLSVRTRALQARDSLQRAPPRFAPVRAVRRHDAPPRIHSDRVIPPRFVMRQADRTRFGMSLALDR
jgi:hypothetical protein